MSSNNFEGIKHKTNNTKHSLLGMMHALLETSGDADASVREAVHTSLTTIGLHSPPLLLNNVHAYLAKNTKVGNIIAVYIN
jgi:hypothetical protein